MAQKLWRGDAQATAQVRSYAPASVTVGNVFSLHCNGKTISFTATATTAANVVAGLVTAVNATTIPEFKRVTASGTTVLFLTAKKAGQPFTITSSSADGAGSAGHSFNAATVTASSGPNHYGIAANWEPSGVPVDNDDVVLNGSVSILYDLDQSSVDLASFTKLAGFTGEIGLPPYNPEGYYEYLGTTLTYNSVNVADIGEGQGNGSSSSRINFGTNEACVATIHKTGTPKSSALPALILSGGQAGSSLNVLKGLVGLAVETGTTAEFSVIRVGSQGQTSDAVLVCGAGCTLGTIDQCGGNVTVETDVVTWTKTVGSSSSNLKSSDIDSLVQDGQGTHLWLSDGTIEEAVMRGQGAVLDASRDLRDRTLTGGTFYDGAALIDPNQTVSITDWLDIDTQSLKNCNLGNAPFSITRT